MRVTKKHYSKCSVFAFGFETHIKRILPLINCLINEALLVADHISIRYCFSSLTSLTASHWFLITMFLRVGSVGDSRRWCSGVVFMQPGVKVNGAYYCDVLLLKQLLPYICQAAGDFCFPAHHVCAGALSCCDTRLGTSHQTWPPNRPVLSSVEYRLLRVIQECVCQ